MAGLTLDDLKTGDNLITNLYGLVGNANEIQGKLIGRGNYLMVPTTSTVPTDHVNVYRELPTEIQNTIEDDWRSYNYLMIRKANGDVVYIGEPWVIQGTLLLNNFVQATVTLDEFREADLEHVKALLTSNGYKVKSVSLATTS